MNGLRWRLAHVACTVIATHVVSTKAYDHEPLVSSNEHEGNQYTKRPARWSVGINGLSC